MSKYHAIATRYDSGFGTIDYTCDSCGSRQRSAETPPGWSESGKEHRCPGCAPGGTFRSMTVEKGADAVMAQLSADDINYAAHPARGEFAGFAALHDRMDANMILPFAEELDFDDERETDSYLGWANAVMDEVSRRIVGATP